MNFVSQYLLALKKCGPSLYLVFIVFTFFDQSLTVLMESSLRSPNGMTASVFYLGAMYLTCNIFFTTLLAFVAIYGFLTTETSLLVFLQRNLNQGCIEAVRGWGKTLLWSFALILPGFIKFLQFLFIPLIVADDERYNRGETDALATSKRLFKQHWPLLVFIFFGFQIVWGYASTDLFDSYRLIWKTPIQALLISLLESFVFLVYMLLIFKVYRKSQDEVGYETHV